MPLVKRLRGRNANIVVVANAELLFVPEGMMSRWNNSISQRVRLATAAFAPTNQRPRWGHYGKPLKSSFTATTAVDAASMRTQAAIGSTAPHAMYVNNGTAAFNAKVLPPTAYGAPNLREAGFSYPSGNPAQPWNRTGAIPVRGQKAQRFFERGLDAGMAASGIVLVPGGPGGTSKDTDLLAGFKGNTPVDAGFIASLNQWRSWRDAAWAASRGNKRSKSRLSEGRKSRADGLRRKPTDEDRRRDARNRQRRQRERNKARNQQVKAAQDRDRGIAQRQEQARVLKAAQRRFGPNLRQVLKSNGQWIATVRGRNGITRPFALTKNGWVAVRR